jgi:group I intron endonuclease
MDKNCGIYKITSPSGRVYIGQSVNIKRRWTDYRSRVKIMQEPLARSFKKYGVENHQFDIIEYCIIEDLNCSERFWQEEFEVIGKNGLNCILTQCGEEKYQHSEETKKKISESKKGAKNPLAKKVENITTGEIWESITSAAEANNIKLITLSVYLNGRSRNKTNLRFL